MVNVGRGRLFRRKDNKYLIYLPKGLTEDSMFPFRLEKSVKVKMSFELGGDQLMIEPISKESELKTLEGGKPEERKNVRRHSSQIPVY